MHAAYLIRHGKSSLDGGESERGLTPEGMVHARQVTRRLLSQVPPVKAIYSSPYRRAQLTVVPLAKTLSMEIVIVDEFREKIMSTEPVDDLKVARSRMWEDFDYKLPGGESNAEAQSRGVSALDNLKSVRPDEAVAVACHGTLIALILNSFDPSFGYEAWRSMPMPDIFRVDFPGSDAAVIHHIGVPDADGFKVQD